MNKQQNKISRWQMRTDVNDRAYIAKLAKSLGVKESEAVRRAVVYSLANMPKAAIKA